jgi:hypothetical protein
MQAMKLSKSYYIFNSNDNVFFVQSILVLFLYNFFVLKL